MISFRISKNSELILVVERVCYRLQPHFPQCLELLAREICSEHKSFSYLKFDIRYGIDTLNVHYKRFKKIITLEDKILSLKSDYHLKTF